MASIFTILGIIIPIVSLILSVLVNLYPKEATKFIKFLSRGYKKVKEHLFSFSQSVNYTNIVVGIVIIAFVFLLNEGTAFKIPR